MTAKDSLFETMEQAMDVYQSIDFDDGHGGRRFASSRSELETAFGAAITANRLALSPPAPATLTVTSGSGKGTLAWTLNTTTGSSVAHWRVYRALGSYKGDIPFDLIAELPGTATGYEDTNVNVGASYFYYVTTVGANGAESTVRTATSTPMVPLPIVAVRDSGRPLVFALGQNAPNPFNPSTTIRFSIAEPGLTTLNIYSVDGQLVKALVNGSLAAGSHEIAWDGRDEAGRLVASGTYIYRLVNGSNVQVRRMVLVK